MLIRGVTLRNIRSYEELDLAFEEGITLLTGDIGAGKTTILAAIEFALFGLQRTILDGDALLRHGADDGSVSLTFVIDQREITITRALRRTGQGVRQSDGSLSIDGSLEHLSAQELKARVLELLGYPEALLTKSKGLVFRHTVYTPQEDMKAILWLPIEERLNTLRTLFGIERYKIITQNAALVVRELRAEERTHLAHATNLLMLEREQQGAAERLAAANKRHADAQRTLDAATLALTKHRETLMLARAANDAALKAEAERTRFSQRVRELERSVLNATEDLAHTNELLERTPEPIQDCSVELETIRAEQLVLDRELRVLSTTVAEAATERKIRLSQTNTIATMDSCPVCKQQVTAHHKHAIAQETNTLLVTLTRTVEKATEHECALRTRHAVLAQKILSLTEQQRRFSGYQKELLARAEHERQRARFHTRFETLTRDLMQARHDLSHVAPLDIVAHEHYVRAEETARAAEELREERLRALRIAESEVSGVSANAATITERLATAQAAQAAAITVQSRRSWLEETFLPAVTTVESHVLASVQREFAELFTSHFTALIEDDTITVSLGEQFEPLVTQNGYDATLEQLSGGEKTAVALSYRLALYRVVSDFLRTITTRDILILDEPTDGFSTEQLSRVRDVIRGLGCRQVILVSHEQGMEGTCDHVIRVSKRLHRSVAVL